MEGNSIFKIICGEDIKVQDLKIDNSSYIKTQIENPVKDIDFIWLNPIKNALNENQNKGLS